MLEKLIRDDRAEQGHICFEVARNDVKTLRLYVNAPDVYTTRPHHAVWFALR